MNLNNHPISDKRKKKPKVYSIQDIQQDITMQNIETYKIGKSELRFDTPNITSIFLSVSDKEFQKAKIIYNALIKSKETSRKLHVFSDEETVMLYDYLEHIQTSIIALYSAIESLVNSLIPDEYEYEQNNGKGVKEVWNKNAIERWKLTKEKLKDIIPKALNITSPSNYKCWTRFTQFEELRNDLIHVKSTSITNVDREKKLIGILISDSVFTKLNAGKDLIKELSKAVPHHYEYPILNDTEPLIPIKIASWDDLNLIKSD
jgi:hypothetical protein